MKGSRDAKSAILAAAADAFVAGRGDLEMNDVAKRAGVSVGLAYHYFRSKAGLVSALITDFYDRYDAVVNRRFEPGLSWSARESRRLLDVVEFLFSDPLAPAILGSLRGDAEIAAVETARRSVIIELAAENIRRGQSRGEINPEIDPEIAAAIINGGLREAVAVALADPCGRDARDFARQSWALIEGALGLGAAPAASPLAHRVH